MMVDAEREEKEGFMHGTRRKEQVEWMTKRREIKET